MQRFWVWTPPSCAECLFSGLLPATRRPPQGKEGCRSWILKRRGSSQKVQLWNIRWDRNKKRKNRTRIACSIGTLKENNFSKRLLHRSRIGKTLERKPFTHSKSQTWKTRKQATWGWKDSTGQRGKGIGKGMPFPESICKDCGRVETLRQIDMKLKELPDISRRPQAQD